jgi:hypothetical protein
MDQENFAQRIRDLKQEMMDAEIAVAQSEANLKKLYAMKKVEAAARGLKADNAQQTYADADDEIFAARLEVGKQKALLAAAKVEARARDVEFETWRTEQANVRRERSRYG